MKFIVVLLCPNTLSQLSGINRDRRTNTKYNDNDPVWEEKRLKKFVFHILPKKWDKETLSIDVYDENTGAQEIQEGFRYVRNYFTHIMLNQVSVVEELNNISPVSLILN